jgi:hypothetical protein
MRVSFDSMVWEKIFDPKEDCECAPIRAALTARRLEGFICAAGFRIEAIKKQDRAAYFAKSYVDCRFEGIDVRDAVPYLKTSCGPDNTRHPGLPSEQAGKLKSALATGIQLLRGSNWTDLPEPREILDPAIYVLETSPAAHEREQRQIDVSDLIDARGVGRGAVAAVYNKAPVGEKRFSEACAEWADGELVAAHIAYQNNILCTNDFGRTARTSIFNLKNRSWLTTNYGVVFKTIYELLAEIAK